MKCAPKKFENPAKLFDPSEMPSVMVQTGHVSDMRGPSVMPSVNSVGDAVGIGVGNPLVNVAKSRNFFATLCEIPTGYIPLVYPLVKR